MSAPRLDKSRDYGQIHPAYHGALFSQDGHYFSGSGDYMFSEGDDPSKPRKAKKAAPKTAAAPSNDDSGSNGGASTGDDIDLAAWASGELKVPFFTIKKVVSKAYPGMDVSNAQAIKDGLQAIGAI